MTTETAAGSTKIARQLPIWIPAAGGFLLGLLLLFAVDHRSDSKRYPGRHEQAFSETAVPPGGTSVSTGIDASTKIYAHNLRLRQGPDFRVYIGWLRGQLKRASPAVIPSLDDPESFYLNVTNGVIRANVGDLCNYLNSRSTNNPLTDVRLTGAGDQMKITGKLHKVIPVEVLGTLKPASNNRIQVQVTKINVVNVPFKAVLGKLHVTLSGLLPSEKIAGVELVGNDIYFDSNQLLPPPYIRGTLTSISLVGPDLEAVYGDVKKDVARVGEWRNFLQLSGGTLNFGKLTMQKADLILIDISQDAWFDLDLAHYQNQLVNGYSRMTPTQSLQVFMPDVSELQTNRISQISIGWLKNRNVAPPTSVVTKNH